MCQHPFSKLTNVLDLSKLRVCKNLSCGIARVRGQDDTGSASNFFRNLVRVHVVSILLRQWDRNGAEVAEQRQHLVVGSVIWYEEAKIRVPFFLPLPFSLYFVIVFGKYLPMTAAILMRPALPPGTMQTFSQVY